MRRALVVSLLWVASCTSTQPRTEVIVRIEAEPGVMAEATRLHVVLRAGSNRTQDALATRADRTFPETGTQVFPLEIALVPADGDASRVFELTATAQRGASHDDFAMARVISGYVRGSTLALTLTIEDACRDLPACDPGNTCHRAMCVDAYVAPEMLAPYAPGDGGTDAATIGPDDAGMDAGADAGMDAGRSDAYFPDANRADANRDANLPDIGMADAVVIDAGARDTGGARTWPHPIAPLTTTGVTTTEPTFLWELAAGSTGAHVQICADATCSSIETQFDAAGSSATLGLPLAAGLHFWRLASRRGTSTDPELGPTWSFLVPRDPLVANASPSFADGNGDGFADVAVGLENGAGDGLLHGHRGSASGLPTAPSYVLQSREERFGHSTTAIDVDGDGYTDLIVGCNGSPGSVVVFGGGPGDYDDTRATTLSETGAATTNFGQTVLGIGDLDRDGYGDVAVGARGNGSSTEPGVVHVYRGSPAGLVHDRVLAPTTTGTAAFGASLAACDLDGDGFADLAVGAPSQRSVYVYFGGAAGFRNVVSPLVLMGADTQFGLGLACPGDFESDGYADLVVGTPFVGGLDGVAYVYRGFMGGMISQTPTATLLGETGASSGFGEQLGGGDFDGDGYADLVVGMAPAGSYAGQVAWFRGSNGGLITPASLVIPGGASDHLGACVRGIGDVDGDGMDDLAACTTTTARIFLGSASGPATTEVLEVTTTTYTPSTPGVSGH